MNETNQRAVVRLRAVLWGITLAEGAASCEQARPMCQPMQYWSTVLRACVGVGEYMDAHGGSFPDGFVAQDASSSDTSIDATPESSFVGCDGGGRACGASCVDLQSDPLNCGACGVACGSVANATAVCVAGRCDVRCETGAHRCGGNCVRDVDPASCGTRCAPCPEPIGGRSTCAMGACGYACLPGYVDTGVGCAMRAPRPLFPWGFSAVTSLRPTLQWELATGLEGAQVELCRDRACAAVIERLNATGTTVRPSADLPPSTVIFWRLRGRVGVESGTETSATWQFRTPARAAATVDAAQGTELDVNGDGFRDVAISSLEGDSVRVDLFHGSAAGLVPASTVLRPMVNNPESCSLASIGDVNGDGFGDLAIGMENSNLTGAARAGVVLVHLGSSAGLSVSPALSVEGIRAMERAGRAVVGIGDVNGDGYSDFVDASSLGHGPSGVVGTGRVRLFLGAAMLSASPAATLYPMEVEGFGASCAGGDFNGDRLADLACWSAFAQPNGRASVYRGSRAGFSLMPDVVVPAPPLNTMGGIVSITAADVNGDGLADLALGMANASNSGGLSSTGAIAWHLSTGAGLPVTPSGVIEGSSLGGQLGGSLCIAGDVNGDGFVDVVASEGRTVRVLNGSAMGLMVIGSQTLRELSPTEHFARSFAGAGDVDHDGFSDLLVSAPQATVRSMSNAGSARLFRGSMTGVASSSQSLDGVMVNSYFGTVIAR